MSSASKPFAAPLDPINELVSILRPVRRAWVQAANRTLAEVGLPTALGAVIVVTARLGERVQQMVLAAEVGVNPAALVRTLDQGEAAGLLVREKIEGDRRGKSVSLSREGRVMARKMEDRLATLRAELMGDLPVADILAATQVLRTLAERATTPTAVGARVADHAAR